MTPVRSILVVEDNPSTRKMLRVALMVGGYAVVEAADAREAIAAAGSSLPDLILQDLILPDMDGLELLRRLRAIPGGRELPILALSGFLSRLEEAKTTQDGFTALLVKPVEPSRLIDFIRGYLPQEPAPATLGGQGRRLLAVDDDPVQLKLTRIHFSQLGFHVFVASSASEALSAARAHSPDVILSDVFMPDTDGFEFCLEVHRDPQLASVPVVLLSAHYGSDADKDLARRVGASALVLRTPDFEYAAAAVLEALGSPSPAAADLPGDQLTLRHARLVIHQLKRQAETTAGLVQRCGIQAGQLSLLSGVADALTRNADPDVALRDVLAATLDAAGLSKGALILRDDTGALTMRQDIGFSAEERSRLLALFGRSALLDDIVDRGASVSIPSLAIPESVSRDLLAGANITAVQIVPLMSNGRGVGAMVIGATGEDVTGEDCVAFARAMGNQIVQSVELARSVARVTVSEQRYRTLLEHATDFVAVLTPEGIVREMNHRWMDFTGLPQEQLIGRHVREFAPPGKEEQNAQIYNEAVSTNTAVSRTVEIAGRNGSSAFIEISSTKVDVGGEVVVFAIGRDVTERRNAVEALRTAEERMRFALQNAHVGIWDMDYTTGLLRWSETIEAQYGLRPGTFGGTFEAFLERIHPDDRASMLETIGNATTSGTDFSVQHRSIWPDGTIRWLSGTGRVSLGESSEPVRAVGISQDVTDRVRADEEFRRLHDEVQLQRLRVFKATMTTVHDIVNNLLNGFHLVRLEGEGQIPESTLALVDQIIEEAALKLSALGDLKTVTEKKMAVGMGIDYPGAEY